MKTIIKLSKKSRLHDQKWLRGMCYFMILIAAISCQEKVDSVTAFRQWLHQSDNGFTVEKQSNNLILTASYLPNTYLAYRDLQAEAYQNQNIVTFDSLKQLYEHSITFTLTLRPDKTKKASGDVMYRGVNNYMEYKQRATDLNFGMEAYFSLKAGAQTLKPVLSTFENTYSMVEHRTIYLVFTEEQAKSSILDTEELELVFNDEIFQTGISHFKFKKENLQQLPNCIIN